MKQNRINCAIVLAAGAGKRMQSTIHKQYMLLREKPLIYYPLRTFEDSFIDHIILVVAPGETEYCRKEIVEKYHFQKVAAIVEGGRERYHSVYAGLLIIEKMYGRTGNIYIHDGARPLVTQAILEHAREALQSHEACVVGMPVKDTIKQVNSAGMVVHTPQRSELWLVQTPQCFRAELVMESYQKMMDRETKLQEQGIQITDDAMVVEQFGGTPVQMVTGDYKNIKVTTPEDILIANQMMSEL